MYCCVVIINLIIYANLAILIMLQNINMHAKFSEQQYNNIKCKMVQWQGPKKKYEIQKETKTKLLKLSCL
jgi:hypothetical protein